MKLKIALMGILLLFTHTSFATFCPNNFNIVNEGDSMDKVIALCGQPLSKKETRDTSNQPQQWSFYPATSRNQGTLKLNVALVGGIIKNISINNISLRSTDVCGAAINVGDSVDKLRNACGDPADTNFSDNTQGVQFGTAADIITELHYQGTSAVTFLFKNGKLTQKR